MRRLHSKKPCGLREEGLNIFSVGYPIHSCSNRNHGFWMNAFARPTIFIDERDNFECESVRVEDFSCFDFIDPERAILSELVAYDPSPKNPRCRCFGVKEEKISPLQSFPSRLKTWHDAPDSIGNTSTPILLISGEHPIGCSRCGHLFARSVPEAFWMPKTKQHVSVFRNGGRIDLV